MHSPAQDAPNPITPKSYDPVSLCCPCKAMDHTPPNHMTQPSTHYLLNRRDAPCVIKYFAKGLVEKPKTKKAEQNPNTLSFRVHGRTELVLLETGRDTPKRAKYPQLRLSPTPSYFVVAKNAPPKTRTKQEQRRKTNSTRALFRGWRKRR